jgi:hypothetical protein
MKKIFVGLFLLVASITQAQTADEIIAKYETAAGGREKLEGVKMLEVISSLKLSLMGNTIDMPITLVREKGKLFRRQVGGLMGMGDSFTMLTDTSGTVYIGGQRGFGGGGGGGFGGGGFGGGPGAGGAATVLPLKPEEVTAQQYELDCAGGYPELVNYAAKGHTAVLVGTEKVNKVVCSKIKLTFKTGQVVTYYIDNETFLVKQLEATGEVASNLTGLGPLMKAYGRNPDKNTKATIKVKEWGEFKGVKYPTKYSLSYFGVDAEVENHTIQINEGLEEKWYHPKP